MKKIIVNWKETFEGNPLVTYILDENSDMNNVWMYAIKNNIKKNTWDNFTN
jgi:hypothetical protein